MPELAEDRGAGAAGVRRPLQRIVLTPRGFGEVSQQVRILGHVAHVWSSYETREREDLPARVRGVDTFQMLHDGTRWCILSATWDAETPAHPLPKEL